MRVSVIVTIPAREALRASAASAFTTAMPSLDIAEPTRRGSLILDPTFPAVPLSSSAPEDVNLLAASADTAPFFVARGTVDAEEIDQVEKSIDGIRIFSDPEIGLFPHCGPAPVGTVRDVVRRLDVAALAAKRLTGSRVAVAIMDTGIDRAHLRAAGLKVRLDTAHTWAPAGTPRTPGRYPADHGTMCAFDALIAAPRATLLDFPILRSRTPGGSVMAGFLSDALLAFSYLLNAMSAPDWRYRALVINNSWGMYHPSWDFPAGHPGRYADNKNHPFNVIVSTLARAGADILFAAGNCGADCPAQRCQGVVRHSITGANAHPDVLTLAGCDIHDDRVGYSSQGPAIPGMKRKKPDVTSYTHFLGSKAFGTGTPDSGTSTACPVAAGCVAAVRTRLSPGNVPPAQLFDDIRAHALSKPAPGWNRDYGFGIFKPVPLAVSYGL